MNIQDMLKNNLKNPWFYLGCVLAAGVLAAAIYYYMRYQSTDNAYVNAHTTALASQVSGKIVHVLVDDHQAVVKGQILFEVESLPFSVALNKAKAELELAKQMVAADAAAVDAAKALVNVHLADLEKTALNTPRIEQLVGKKFLSKAEEDNAVAALKTAQAALAVSKAQLVQAEKNYGTPGNNNPKIKAALADVAEAELNLKYTQILSPSNGFISELNAEVGKVVQPGESLCSFINSSYFWIDANFKETQIVDIRVGQKAEISIDMYPDLTFQGYVESISPNTGTAFALLPPQNASGNWVKVTQRVPVKIRVKNPNLKFPLRIGTSAVVTVDLHSKPDEQ